MQVNNHFVILDPMLRVPFHEVPLEASNKLIFFKDFCDTAEKEIGHWSVVKHFFHMGGGVEWPTHVYIIVFRLRTFKNNVTQLGAIGGL